MFHALASKCREFFGKNENYIPLILSEIAYYCQEMRRDDQYSYTVNDFSTHLTHDHGFGSNPMLRVVHTETQEVVCFIENKLNDYFTISNLKLMDSLKFIDSFNIIKKHYKLRSNTITLKDGKISKVVVVLDLNIGSILNKKEYNHWISIVTLIFDRNFNLTAVYRTQTDSVMDDELRSDKLIFNPMTVEEELFVIVMKTKMLEQSARDLFPEWCIPSAYDFSNPYLLERLLLLEIIDY